MPLYSYQCKSCQHDFETLVVGTDLPVCPQCGGGDLQRLIGGIAPHGKLKDVTSKVRAQAAREGHFSNYSKSELKRR